MYLHNKLAFQYILNSRIYNTYDVFHKRKHEHHISKKIVNKEVKCMCKISTLRFSVGLMYHKNPDRKKCLYNNSN